MSRRLRACDACSGLPLEAHGAAGSGGRLPV